MQRLCHGQLYGRREVPIQRGLPAELVQVCGDGVIVGMEFVGVCMLTSSILMIYHYIHGSSDA